MNFITLTLIFLQISMVLCQSFADSKYLITKENQLITFNLPQSRTTTLTFWTNDTEATFNLQLKRKTTLIYNREFLHPPTNVWNFLLIAQTKLFIFNYDFDLKASSRQGRKLTLKSNRLIIWKLCSNWNECDLPPPSLDVEPTEEPPSSKDVFESQPDTYFLPSVLLAVFSFLLMIAILVLFVYVIRVKKLLPKDPLKGIPDDQNLPQLEEENIYEEVDIMNQTFNQLNRQQSSGHDSINSLYGAVIPR